MAPLRQEGLPKEIEMGRLTKERRVIRSERVNQVHERLTGQVGEHEIVVLVEGAASGLADLLAEAGGDRVLFARTQVEAEGVIGEAADFFEFGGAERTAGISIVVMRAPQATDIENQANAAVA